MQRKILTILENIIISNFNGDLSKASGRKETILLTLVNTETDLTMAETAKKLGADHKDFPLRNIKHFLYR